MKVILAGYSSELINLMKKCNFNISGVVEPNEKIKIVNYNVFLSDNDAIKTIMPDGVVIGIDDIDRKKNVHSIYVKHKIKCLDLILGSISKSSVFFSKNALNVSLPILPNPFIANFFFILIFI